MHRSIAAVLVATAVVCAAASGRPARAAVTAHVVAGAQEAPPTGYLRTLARRGCIRHIRASATGNGSGTSRKPWTLAQGIRFLRPGQAACVHAGTYHAGRLTAAHSGTRTRPIALQRAPGENRPRIVATQPPVLFDFGPGIGYWELTGLDLRMNHRDITAVQLLGSRTAGGSGGMGVGPAAIRGNSVEGGAAGAAILIRNGGHDILIEKNWVHHHRRWCDAGPDARCDEGDPVHFSPGPQSLGRRRSDANAINLEGAGNERVRVRRNTLSGLGGDGLQCLGVDDTVGPSPDDTKDLDIVDNRAYRNAENAVDIKSCQRVSVRNSASAAGKWAFFDYRPTNRHRDSVGNYSDGDALVVHFYAREVLLAGLRIRTSCDGVAVGRDVEAVRDLVIRRVRTSGFRKPSGRCRSDGISVNRVNRADIHHNRLEGLSGSNLVLASYNGSAQISDDVDVFANRFVATRPNTVWINAWKPYLTGFDSNRNRFCASAAGAGTPEHFLIGGTAGGPFRVALPRWRTEMGVDAASKASCAP